MLKVDILSEGWGMDGKNVKFANVIYGWSPILFHSTYLNGRK